jgi:hypothetical protein
MTADQIEAMSRRKSPKPAAASPQSGSTVALRRALTGRRKAELVEIVLQLAQADRGTLRRITARLDVAASAGELVAGTRQAIADATAFDPRDINRNFRYDYEAYGEVKRNLARLIAVGELRLAMQLALELMRHGSHQVEMSDEGMMTADIEECLREVLHAVEVSDLPVGEVTAWCSAMLASDRVGFIARQPLEALRHRFSMAAGE